MVIEVCEQEFLTMEAELQKIDAATYSPLARLKAALEIIRKSLRFLTEHLLDHPLASEEEQILYGKVLLPRCYAWYIYHQEWYAIISALPVGTQEQVKTFWLDELRQVNRFPSRYSLHHAIYKMGSTELDQVFFIPGKGSDKSLMPDIPEFDAMFPTPCGYLFAKFRAYEMLCASVIETMDDKPLMEHAPASARKRTRVMRWTGDSINLAELAFGIHDTGQINEGTATLTEIFEWMEEVLHIKLGRPTRRFDSIEARKNISPTDFLDRMKREINSRIDQKYAFDPEAEQEKLARKERRAETAAKAKALKQDRENNAGL